MSVQTVMDKWTREATRHLIDFYREEPCLRNVKSVEYRNRDRKATALQKIAEHMNSSGWSLSAEDVRKKIDTLRNQHRRDRRHVQQSMKSRAGANDVYIPRLWCYDALSFLNDGDDPRPSVTNIDRSTHTPDDVTTGDHSDSEVRTYWYKCSLTHSLTHTHTHTQKEIKTRSTR